MIGDATIRAIAVEALEARAIALCKLAADIVHKVVPDGLVGGRRGRVVTRIDLVLGDDATRLGVINIRVVGMEIPPFGEVNVEYRLDALGGEEVITSSSKSRDVVECPAPRHETIFGLG